MNEPLPDGWRGGWYTGAELRALSVGAAAVTHSEELLEANCAWETERFGKPATEQHRDAVGFGIDSEHGERTFPGGVVALVVVSYEAPGYQWLGPGSTTFVGPEGEKHPTSVVLPEWHGRGEPMRGAPGTMALFARLWRKRSLWPCLTWRATGEGAPSIALEGLEHARTIGDAKRLLDHLRFLERLAERGRPTLDLSEQSDKRRLLERAESLKRQSPLTPWWRLARFVGVPVSTLHKWRRAAKSG